jgi:hypothetical protein
MPLPLPLRGLVYFVDQALDPRTATRNARNAAAGLAEQLRQLDDVERALHRAADNVASEARPPMNGRVPGA